MPTEPIEHVYESIPGWFNFDDIYRAQVERAQDGAVFVEVGSWLGRSTSFMAVEIANSGKAITFYAVDTWKGSPAPQYQTVVAEIGGAVYDAFRANMRRAPVAVCPLRGDSADLAHSFNDDEVDFVFLDAAHDFHSVRRDVHAWLPKLRVGGVLAGHDANCPGLMNAVKEFIPADQIAYVGTSWMHTIPLESIYAKTHQRLAPGITMPQALVSTIGIWDASLGRLADADYLYRCNLAGHTGVTAGPMKGVENTPDWGQYIQKWGGPPGGERFDFPYGVTTLDW
jgi:predicted O-methyltransferase YrrM